MIKLLRNNVGPKLLKLGQCVELSDSEEKYLVDIGAAEYIKETVEEVEHVDEKNFDVEDDYFKSENEIRSMKKDKLVEYAKEIGIEDFNISSTKEVMIDSIMNYIEENSDSSEDTL